MSAPLDAAPAATIVVPTKNRPIELERCVRALQHQRTSVCFDIVVVDDASVPPVEPSRLGHPVKRRVTLVQAGGRGPAAARNLGVRAARGPIVLFTDDDTIPAEGWVDAACGFLARNADHDGVEGPTSSPPYDPLYFHSVETSTPGSFFTCNIAYRRAAIDNAGGFSEDFPHPHGEDLDLGFRIAKVAQVGFDQQMRVTHPPAPASLLAEVRRGLYMASDVHLYRRHPALYPGARRLSAPGYAVFILAKGLVYVLLRDPYGVRRSPRRAARLAVFYAGYSTLGIFAVIREAFRGAHRDR